jgi:hypothetical protein
LCDERERIGAAQDRSGFQKRLVAVVVVVVVVLVLVVVEEVDGDKDRQVNMVEL